MTMSLTSRPSTATTDRPPSVVVAGDHLLVREGIVRVLERDGLDVPGVAATADDLLGLARAYVPDAVVVDVDMGPGSMRAALSLRRSHPGIAVLAVSRRLETGFVLDLLDTSPTGVGYLLKEKIAATGPLADAVRRVAEGGSALDPDVIAWLVRPGGGRLAGLTTREQEVLALIARGLSNNGVAKRLFLTNAAVERHITGIFGKLGLHRTGNEQHRRVLAVRAYLRAVQDVPSPRRSTGSSAAGVR